MYGIIYRSKTLIACVRFVCGLGYLPLGAIRWFAECSKMSNSFFLLLLSYKMFIIRAGIHILLVRIANRENPDQTASLEAVKKQSDLGLHCLF